MQNVDLDELKNRRQSTDIQIREQSSLLKLSNRKNNSDDGNEPIGQLSAKKAKPDAVSIPQFRNLKTEQNLSVSYVESLQRDTKETPKEFVAM